MKSEVNTLVLNFITERLADPVLKGAFTAGQLRVAVLGGATVAPGTSDRILRLLRKKGLINYTLLNRAQSLYRALPVETPVVTAAA